MHRCAELFSGGTTLVSVGPNNIIGTMVSFRLAAFLTALTVASAERFNEIKVSVSSGALGTCRVELHAVFAP